VHANTKSRILKSLRRDTRTAEKWLHRIENEIAFARAFTAAMAGKGDVPEKAPAPLAVTEEGMLQADGGPVEASRGPAAIGAEKEPVGNSGVEGPAGWVSAIDRAQELLDNFDANLGAEALEEAVRRAEDELADIGRAAKEYTIHCVAHGHIDMNWMWSWPETVSMTHDTFASVLSLMEQYPDLTYSQSQASVYAAIEKYHPAMFEQIKQRVKDGRWEVTACHWVEGDKNISSGESLCRHLLYTRQYFKDKFGLEPEDVPVEWEPDTFGHANTIPMIVSAGAVKYYYSCRTGGGFEHARIGDERPPLFWWQAPDGSRVLVNKELTWYNSYVNIGANVALPMCRFVTATGLHHWLNVYGIGNHGGGPTRDEIDYLISTRDWPIYPQVIFSTAKRYFELLDAEVRENGVELPVLDHELNFEFTGCYTSQSLIKQANRLGENYCEEAETLAVLHNAARPQHRNADSFNRAIQQSSNLAIREAWINVLFNQFHDILPGSGIRETREHARALFQETGAITGAIKREALKALVKDIDTASLLPDTPEGKEERRMMEAGQANTPFVAGSGIGSRLTGYSQSNGGGKNFKPVIVYNPCSWTRSEPVTVALYDTDFDPSRIVALDDTGVAHSTMSLGKGHDWGHDKITVLFHALDVPPLGYKTYLLCEGAGSARVSRASGAPNGVLAIGNEEFETPFFRCRFNRHHGGLDWIKVKTGEGLGEESCWDSGAWGFVLERDKIMSAWVLGQTLEAPTSLISSSFRTHGPIHNEATLLTDKEGLVACRVEWQLKVPDTKSTAKVTATVHGLAPRIDFEVELDWREIGTKEDGIPGLIVDFAGGGHQGGAEYETPFGHVNRILEGDAEVPTLRYTHIPGDAEDPGLTVLQDGKYGFSGGGVGGTVMRVIRSSFDPDHAPEVNKQTFRYSIVFHDEPAPPSELTRLGAAFNHPLIIAPANMQEGSAPTSKSFVDVMTPSVVLTSMKPAEDGHGIVLRLVEYDGQDTAAEVWLNPDLTQGFTRADLCDVLERPTGASLTVDDDILKVPIQANGFVTVKLS
jgi:alpha-mannosidase